MRRGAERHLHPAAGRGRLPQPAERAPLHRRHCDAALFDDPRFTVTDIGPFVLAIRKP